MIFAYRWDEKDAEQLGRCYKDFARFMFGTMNEIQSALPKEISRKNVNVIREIVCLTNCLMDFHLMQFVSSM